jgi:hypothetical protein
MFGGVRIVLESEDPIFCRFCSRDTLRNLIIFGRLLHARYCSYNYDNLRGNVGLMAKLFVVNIAKYLSVGNG